MNLWHLRVGLGFAIEALGREENDQAVFLIADAVREDVTVKNDPSRMVKDRFARFCQDCRLTREETEALRASVFEKWVRS